MSKSQQELEAQEIKQLEEYEKQLADAERRGMASQPYSAAMFSGQQKQNLIEWELDFKPELESIERLLRCDILVINKETNKLDWAPNPDKSLVLFNDAGVNDLIRNIVVIVNKNKALSNYSDIEINERVRQIKHEIRTLIYTNYEKYGFDNEYKVNNYSMIVLSVGSIIEDVYRRAMNGETHRGLAEQRQVLQTDPLVPQGIQGYPTPQPKQGGLRRLMPWNLFGNK